MPSLGDRRCVLPLLIISLLGAATATAAAAAATATASAAVPPNRTRVTRQAYHHYFAGPESYEEEERYLPPFVEYERVHHFGFKKHRGGGSLTGLLALLAPLAALPLVAGTALPLTMAPLMVPAMATVIAGRRRRRQAAAVMGLDAIQSYLQRVSPGGAHQDEVMASYLDCSGMLARDDHCLERLVCQFSAGDLAPLEKDVASLIIYTLVKNRFIAEHFKARLRDAAHRGKIRPGGCRAAFDCRKRRRPPLHR